MQRVSVHSFAACALAIVLAACQAVDQPVAPAKMVADAAVVPFGRPVEVDVVAASGWQSAGVKLAAGVTYRLTATGTWSVGPICGVTDANGNSASPLCIDSLGIGVPGGTLLGRIGPNGKPFAVGTSKTLKPEAEGELFLGPYDRIPSDNTGTLKVRIVAEDGALGEEPAPPHHDPL